MFARHPLPTLPRLRGREIKNPPPLAGEGGEGAGMTIDE